MNNILLAMIVNILFAVIYPLGKIAMAYFPPFFVIGLRMLCTALIYIAWMHAHKQTITISRSFLKQILLLGVFNIFLTNAFEFWGLQYMSSAKTAFIYNLSPFFSAILGYIYFSEKMTLKKVIGLGISFLGFIPVFISSAPLEADLSHLMFISTAEFSILIAAIATVFGWITMQDIMRREPEKMMIANGLSMFIGAGLSFATSLAVEPIPLSAFTAFSLMSWLQFLVLLLAISIITALVYASYSHLLTVYTATFMTMIQMSGPLFAGIFDWILFGTPLSIPFIMSLVIVFIGMYIFYQEDLRQGYILPH